jgi:hypothetical protein
MNYISQYFEIKNPFKPRILASIQPILEVSELVHLISTFICIKDNLQLRGVNSYVRNDKLVLKEIKYKIKLLKKCFQLWKEFRIRQFFKHSPFPKSLINLFPILPWKSYYQGCTQYIDSIPIGDVTHPIMIGVDEYMRPYMCIKYRCPEWNITSPLSDGSKYCFVTIFQRYSNNKTWVKCREKGPILSCHAMSTFRQEDYEYLIKNILRLLTDKKIMFEARLNAHTWDIGTKMMECSID